MTGGVTDYVPCPVCGEPDMLKESNAEGNSLVFCVNHGCASNGGLNHNAIIVEPSPAQVPAGYEIVKSSLFHSAKQALLLGAKLVATLADLAKAKSDMDAAQGSNVAVFFLAGDKIEAEEKLGEYSLALRSALIEYRNRAAEGTVPSTALQPPPSAEEVKLAQLSYEFIKDCGRKKGRTVSGDDLSASAARLLERLDAVKGQKQQ